MSEQHPPSLTTDPWPGVKRQQTILSGGYFAHEVDAALTLERQQHQQALDALRAERDRLKEQMQVFAHTEPETWNDTPAFKAWMQSQARAALTPTQEPT